LSLLFVLSYAVASLKLFVTCCGNSWCHPIFSSKNTNDFFSHHPLKSTAYFSIFSSHLVTTRLLRLQRHLSSVRCKFSHKKLISFGCHPPDGVTLSSPPSNVTEAMKYRSAKTGEREVRLKVQLRAQSFSDGWRQR